jgi:hypothetical protein
MRLMKSPILISLVFFAAVAYAPASHLVAYDVTSCNVCPSDTATGIQ